MIEINQEVVDGIDKGLGILSDYCKINNDIEIKLESLRLSSYSGNIDSWLFSIAEMLFTFNIETISSKLIKDVKEIYSIINKYDPSYWYTLYDDFLYLYDHYEDEYFGDYDIIEEKYFSELEEYLSKIEIECLEFSVPILDNVEYVSSCFVDFIPALVENYFGICGYSLLNIDVKYDFESNKNIIVMYICSDHTYSFMENISLDALLHEFEELLYQIHFNATQIQ